jgi:hypothetical protein
MLTAAGAHTELVHRNLLSLRGRVPVAPLTNINCKKVPELVTGDKLLDCGVNLLLAKNPTFANGLSK